MELGDDVDLSIVMREIRVYIDDELVDQVLKFLPGHFVRIGLRECLHNQKEKSRIGLCTFSDCKFITKAKQPVF